MLFDVHIRTHAHTHTHTDLMITTNSYSISSCSDALILGCRRISLCGPLLPNLVDKSHPYPGSNSLTVFGYPLTRVDGRGARGRQPREFSRGGHISERLISLMCAHLAVVIHCYRHCCYWPYFFHIIRVGNINTVGEEHDNWDWKRPGYIRRRK